VCVCACVIISFKLPTNDVAEHTSSTDVYSSCSCRWKGAFIREEDGGRVSCVDRQIDR